MRSRSLRRAQILLPRCGSRPSGHEWPAGSSHRHPTCLPMDEIEPGIGPAGRSCNRNYRGSHEATSQFPWRYSRGGTASEAREGKYLACAPGDSTAAPSMGSVGDCYDNAMGSVTLILRGVGYEMLCPRTFPAQHVSQVIPARNLHASGVLESGKPDLAGPGLDLIGPGVPKLCLYRTASRRDPVSTIALGPATDLVPGGGL